MRGDVGEGSTSLHSAAPPHGTGPAHQNGTGPADKSRRSKPVPYDSFEWQPEQQPPSNGVPRSAWTRSHRRLSRWHRPYTLILVLLDLLSAVAASALAVTFIQKAGSGFRDRVDVFYLVAFVALPLGWIFILWANGSYDRRYL